jgi:hypothetical protein
VFDEMTARKYFAKTERSLLRWDIEMILMTPWVLFLG